MSLTNRLKRNGFTIIELLVVITVVGILATIIGGFLSGARDEAYYSRAKLELNTMSRALYMYELDYGMYPEDVDRDIPPGIEEYLDDIETEMWPKAPWPGSVYDYDVFETGGVDTVQISIRFCEIGAPETCNFPRFEWANNFDVNSSAYWCISGNCQAHPFAAADHPGYCFNCRE